LLRDADLPLRLLEGRGFIDFLGPQDEPWLRVLLGEFARFEGRRAAELVERLAEPLPCEAPYFKRRAASRTLWGLWRRERPATLPPVEVRTQLFAAAAVAELPDREAVMESVAGRLGVRMQALDEALLADLPGERIVRPPKTVPSAQEAVLAINLAIAQTVLMRASSIRIQLHGNARPIVRLAKLRGLLLTMTMTERLVGLAPALGGAPEVAAMPELHVSGPFSLFRHTLLYGRAMASLLPHLAWCHHFQLTAVVSLRGRLAEVQLGTGDPIRPAAPPKDFDSQLEERFARDFVRLAPDWDIIREPEPVRAGATVIFPDFLLRHRLHPDRWLLLEIAGFWTPEYLQNKLARLREAGVKRLLLCIDEARGCAREQLPPSTPVLSFKRRVDAAAVLRIAERAGACML
jgi:predicted nuclease of restriction endonuclease-like RecB superfamily